MTTNPSSSRAWRWYIAVVGVLIVMQNVAVHLGGARNTIQHLTGPVCSLGLATATVFGVRMHRPKNRLAWGFLLASQVSYFSANLALLITQDLLHNMMFPAPADAFYVTSYALLAVALIHMIRARAGGVADRAAMIDAGVMAAGACVVIWQFWLGDSIGGSMPALARLTIFAYPVMDIAMFTLAVRTLVGRGAQPVALKLLSAGLLSLFLTDVTYGWQLSRGLYSAHNGLDTPWMLFYLFVGATALHPSMVRLTEPAPLEHEPRLTRGRLVAMAGATMLAPTVQTLNGVRNHNIDQIIIAFFAVVMFAGVVLRAHLSSLDDARARAALVAKQDELATALKVLKATEYERSQLLDRVIRAGEQERVWVAAELHDGPIQQLSALGFSIDRVRRRLSAGDTLAGARSLEQTRDELTRVVSGLRKLMSELRPPALDESGLEGALRDYVDNFRRDSGVECTVDLDLSGTRLPSELETTLYRVSQEALQNIRRHSQACSATVSLRRNNGAVRLRICDDGRGFDAARPIGAADTSHYGLIGMRERVEQRGGFWKLESQLGAGTTIDAEFPIYTHEPATTNESVKETV